MAGRRIAVYFAWSRPGEYALPTTTQGRDFSQHLGVLENRYPTLFEFRRALWPVFEHLRDAAKFDQGIGGFFDNVVLPDFELFSKAVREHTGHDLQIIQRELDAPPPRQLDDDFLKDFDTLIVVSLDHLRTSQTASPGEIAAVKAFLGEKHRCLIVCPHHDIGKADELAARRVEYAHHGDPTIPASQRLGGFALSLLAGLGAPIQNQFGLNPDKQADGSPGLLELHPEDEDDQNLLRGVTTFNLHPHLPHLAIPTETLPYAKVLARQPINLSAPPHPFTANGARHFNALLRIRPPEVAGAVLVSDATLWSSAFQGVSSLSVFWRNIALMK